MTVCPSTTCQSSGIGCSGQNCNDAGCISNTCQVTACLGNYNSAYYVASLLSVSGLDQCKWTSISNSSIQSIDDPLQISLTMSGTVSPKALVLVCNNGKQTFCTVPISLGMNVPISITFGSIGISCGSATTIIGISNIVINNGFKPDSISCGGRTWNLDALFQSNFNNWLSHNCNIAFSKDVNITVPFLTTCPTSASYSCDQSTGCNLQLSPIDPSGQFSNIGDCQNVCPGCLSGCGDGNVCVGNPGQRFCVGCCSGNAYQETCDGDGNGGSSPECESYCMCAYYDGTCTATCQ